MKSNTPVLLSVAVAVIGAVAITLLSINLNGAMLFAAGAIIVGFIIQFINTGKGPATTIATVTPEADFATTTHIICRTGKSYFSPFNERQTYGQTSWFWFC